MPTSIADWKDEFDDCRNHPNEVVREVLTYLIPRIVRIEKTLHELKEIAMSDQDKLNQVVADLGTVITNVQTVQTSAINVEALLNSLLNAQQSNQPLDFGPIQAEVQLLKSGVAGIVSSLPDPGPLGATGATGGTGTSGATGTTGAAGTGTDNGSVNTAPANS
jgi:hypothetical protein